MRLITRSLFLCLVSCCLIGFTGCQDSGKKKTADPKTTTTDDHSDEDEHGHAETYAEAVAELAELEETIRTGYENDDPDAAHGPLHDVGHVLEEVEAFIKKSDMDDATKKATTQAATDLFDAFTAVDAQEHGSDGGKEFKDVSDTIAAAMAVLQAQLSETAGHDDDGKHSDDGDHKDGDHDKDGEHKSDADAAE